MSHSLAVVSAERTKLERHSFVSSLTHTHTQLLIHITMQGSRPPTVPSSAGMRRHLRLIVIGATLLLLFLGTYFNLVQLSDTDGGGAAVPTHDELAHIHSHLDAKVKAASGLSKPAAATRPPPVLPVRSNTAIDGHAKKLLRDRQEAEAARQPFTSPTVLEREDDDDYGLTPEDLPGDMPVKPKPPQPQQQQRQHHHDDASTVPKPPTNDHQPQAQQQEQQAQKPALLLYYSPVSGFLGSHMLVCHGPSLVPRIWQTLDYSSARCRKRYPTALICASSPRATAASKRPQP